jgi:hypothetical protein
MKTTTLNLSRTAGAPISGVERGASLGAARGSWSRPPTPRQPGTRRHPGRRLADRQWIPADLEREEAFADASIRIDVGGDGEPVLLFDVRDHRAKREW